METEGFDMGNDEADSRDEVEELTDRERPVREVERRPAAADEPKESGTRSVENAAQRPAVVRRYEQASAGTKDPRELPHARLGCEQVLDDLRAEHGVEGPVRERQGLEVRPS
jgi:hypothetical protein